MVANDIKINVDRLAMMCYDGGVYAIESEMENRTMYIYGDGELAITRKNGILRLDVDELPQLIEELVGMYDDLKQRKQEQLELRGSAKFQERLDETILRMSKMGKKPKEIAKWCGVTPSVVSTKKRKFKEKGLL